MDSILELGHNLKKRVNCNTEDRWDKHVHVYMVKMLKCSYYMYSSNLKSVDQGLNLI